MIDQFLMVLCRYLTLLSDINQIDEDSSFTYDIYNHSILVLLSEEELPNTKRFVLRLKSTFSQNDKLKITFSKKVLIVVLYI